MNFDRERQTPNITGLPNGQDFNIPPQSHYSNSVESPYEPTQVVDPFVPPEYENISVTDEEEKPSQNQVFDEQEIINWQAQDVIIGEKDKLWYVWFAIIVLLLIGFSILVQNWTFIALILVTCVAILLTRHVDHSKIISYSLSTRGVYVGNTFHPYDEFKSFGVLREGEIYSIIFVPKKRFSPSTSIYFSKNDGEKITDIIGQRLPMEEIDLDIIDKIVKKIKL